jgi:hypothetical protein
MISKPQLAGRIAMYVTWTVSTGNRLASMSQTFHQPFRLWFARRLPSASVTSVIRTAACSSRRQLEDRPNRWKIARTAVVDRDIGVSGRVAIAEKPQACIRQV